jgi:Saxitoxin biosynthesis operon protein SxtJ
MQWSDTTAPPTLKVLRQFAGLWLIVLAGLSSWRAWHGDLGSVTAALASIGVAVGVLGLIRPAAVRAVYVGAMVAAFPMGWIVSRLALGIIFYLVLTPIALVFRLRGRDTLRLRRRGAASHWMACTGARTPDEYFRQF